MEKQSFWTKAVNFFVKFLILAIVGLFLFNIGRSIWKNHDVEEKITELKNVIADLENQTVNLRNRILYYQTSTYKELEARRHLYYQKPGENVVILVKNTDNVSQTTNPASNTNNTTNTKNKNDNLPNWQKWINYIFG